MASTPANWESLKQIVTDAIDLPADAREAFLAEHCNGDERLLGEVRALVTAYDQADGVIDRRADAWLGLGGPDLLSLGGRRIGRYVLQRLVAEGAMAAVYEARQANPQRTVALKLLRVALPMVDAAGRFRRESQALGRLQHPNIARIYEAGVHQTTDRTVIPFIAMEYVDGTPLTEFAQKQNLDRRGRIQLLIKVAHAVHSAHQQAVIHRDLKPANVLVDESGEPKVLDFGIARIAGEDDASMTLQTTTGVLMGTPGYMSPEQASGQVDAVDVRSDVWALGVLLHELLTGRMPIDLSDTSIAQALKKIETAEPIPIGKIDPTLRGDLEIVTMTALAREKERRYQSAEALAMDLQRVLDYQPITARPPSRWYLARKFVRRHRVGLAFATVVALLLIASSIALTAALIRAARDRDRARAINQFLQEMISSADPSVGAKDTTILTALANSEQSIAASFGNDPRTEADVRSTLGWTYFNLSQIDRAHQQLARAVELRETNGEPADPACIQDQVRLVTVLRWQYKPRQAKAIAERTYEIARKNLGEKHPATVSLLEPLAGCMQDLGDFAAAEKAYLHAIDMNRQILGETHEDTLTAMNNLAVLYTDNSQLQKSEEILRKLVDYRTRTGPEKLQTMSVRLNLAVSLSEQGRLVEAESQLKQLAADAEIFLGPNHETTLDILANHSTALQRRGRTDEAIDVQKRVLDRRIAGFGEKHEPTIKEFANYSSLLSQAKKYDAALAAANKAVAVAGASGDEALIARAKQSLALALSGLGRNDEAQNTFREAIATMEKTLGKDHRRTLVARSNFATALIAGNNASAALEILEPLLLTVQSQKIGFMEATVRRNLGRALSLAGRTAEAERELSTAYRLSAERGEIENARAAAGALADAFLAAGRSSEAKVWRDRSLHESEQR